LVEEKKQLTNGLQVNCSCIIFLTKLERIRGGFISLSYPFSEIKKARKQCFLAKVDKRREEII